jgi:hypothetical protein
MSAARFCTASLVCALLWLTTLTPLAAQEADPPGSVRDFLNVVAPPLEHPEPRWRVRGAGVLPGEAFRAVGRHEVAEAYELAQEIPHVLDGLHSYCNVGRSLLSCFESNWAAVCDYCQTIVRRAHELNRLGYQLDFIRRWHVEFVDGVDTPRPARNGRDP